LEHRREPDVDYADVLAGRLKAVRDPIGLRQCSYKQRGAALGTAGHATFESWYDGKPVDWASPVGRLCASAAHLLPMPDRCGLADVEAPIGFGMIAVNADKPDKPQWAMRESGILWTGYRDLTAYQSGDELRRLGIDADVTLFDYKFKSDLEKYALTPDELLDDTQCALYVCDVSRLTGALEVSARWVQIETKWMHQQGFRPFAIPCDVVMPVSRAVDIIGRAADKARRLDALACAADATPNLDACCDFSGQPGVIGCSYHHTKGGPCNVRLSSGKLIQLAARKEKESHMGIDPALRAKFEKHIAARKATAPVETAPVATAPVETAPVATAPVATAPTITTTRIKPRAPRVTAPAAVETPAVSVSAPATPIAGSKVAALSELLAQLDAQEIARNSAQAAVDATLSRIAEVSLS
jgi:hypothetical protein